MFTLCLSWLYLVPTVLHIIYSQSCSTLVHSTSIDIIYFLPYSTLSVSILLDIICSPIGSLLFTLYHTWLYLLSTYSALFAILSWRRLLVTYNALNENPFWECEFRICPVILWLPLKITIHFCPVRDRSDERSAGHLHSHRSTHKPWYHIHRYLLKIWLCS